MSEFPAGRAPVVNPARRLSRIAASEAVLRINGTSAAGRMAQSRPAPAGITTVHADGSDITEFMTELDFTESEYELTVESTL